MDENRRYVLFAHRDAYDRGEELTPCQRGNGTCQECPYYASCFEETV